MILLKIIMRIKTLKIEHYINYLIDVKWYNKEELKGLSKTELQNNFNLNYLNVYNFNFN